MFALTESQKFYLYAKSTDMRKSFNGLSGLVRTGLQRNLLSGDVFIFINKRTFAILLRLYALINIIIKYFLYI